MSIEEDMAEAVAEMDVRNKIADQIREKNPSIPAISAIIMAGDLRSAEKTWEWMKKGEYTYAQAVHLVGSYARLDFAMKALEAEEATLDQVLDELPELWRGSDPDDTDPRFLDLWQKAWARNNNRYVRDGAPLPRTHHIIVYRGQMENDPMGIAWTLDKLIADKFAHGAGLRVSNMPGIIYIGKVHRRDVLGYLTGRGESEVIVDPSRVKGISE